MLPPKPKLMQIIEAAMLDQAPEMHRELKATKRLQLTLEARAEQAQASYLAGLDRAMLAQGSTPQETINLATQARNEAARTALDQAAEFVPSQPVEGQTL